MIAVDYKQALVNSVAKALNESAASPPSNIMGLATLQNGLPCIPGGEDTLHLGLYCDFVGNASEVFSQLDELKFAEQFKKGRGVGVIKGLEVAMGSTGANAGMHYHYRLSIAGCGMLLSRKLNAEGTCPNVQVVLGSLALHTNGGSKGMFAKLQEWLADLGWIVRKCIVSRADVCIDLVGVPVEVLHKAFAAEAVICRSVNDATYGQNEKRKGPKWCKELKNDEEWEGEGDWEEHRRHRKVTGFRMGADLQLCVYDKVLECKVKQDAEKLSFFTEHLWGGAKNVPVTRVEFRMRRDPLKARGIDSLADWWEQRASIIQYLVNEWCRFTEGHDKRHTERAVVLDTWRRVQEIAAMLFDGAVNEVRTVKRTAATMEGLCRQLLGCASSAASRFFSVDADQLSDPVPVICEVIDYALEKYWSPELAAKYREKVKAFRVKTANIE